MNRNVVTKLKIDDRANDQDWIRARRELLRLVKRQVSDRLGPESSDLRGFARRYNAELSGAWDVSSKRELLKEIARAQIVYAGDFHAFGQAQRTHLKILRSLPLSVRDVVIGLECVSIDAQKHLDKFSSGKIGAHELKVRSNWESEWGFPFESYLPIFELAKARGYRLLALNTPSKDRRSAKQLLGREKAAARRIAGSIAQNEEALHYIVFGDLHIARAHLPAAVSSAVAASLKKRKVKLRDLRIYLNSERHYFELAKRGRELQVDVIRLSKSNDFCVLSSPPWVKWQTYVMFLDRNLDRDLTDDESDRFDATDQVANLAKLAASDLGVKVDVDRLEVYSEDDKRIWRAISSMLGVRDRSIAKRHLAEGKSFFLPERGVAYLSRLSINHAAHAAGHYLHARLSSRSRVLWNLPGDFRSLIWTEGAAYFVSKLINPKRQTGTLADLRMQLASLRDEADSAKEALKLALDVTMSDAIRLQTGRRRPLRFKPRRKSSYLESAKILGSMLGERLYVAFRSHKLSKDEVKEWLRYDVEDDSFSRNYDQIVERLQAILSDRRLQVRAKVKDKVDRL